MLIDWNIEETLGIKIRDTYYLILNTVGRPTIKVDDKPKWTNPDEQEGLGEIRGNLSEDVHWHDVSKKV